MNHAWLGYFLSGCARFCYIAGIFTTKKASFLIPLKLGFLVAITTNIAFSARAFALQWVWRAGPVAWPPGTQLLPRCRCTCKLAWALVFL